MKSFLSIATHFYTYSQALTVTNIYNLLKTVTLTFPPHSNVFLSNTGSAVRRLRDGGTASKHRTYVPVKDGLALLKDTLTTVPSPAGVKFGMGALEDIT